MKFVLILMVRNEEKILERCLQAVEGVVDAFCIHDTGSTDRTNDIAREFLNTRKGCLTASVWQNFGYNRTASFQAARDYLSASGYDLATTYGILLDGDMVLRVGTLLTEPLTEVGYTLIQRGGTLEYPNCRIVRMDHPWICKGVTHEYWDGPTSHLPKTVAWIDDRNDGGCKSDKFERDARLLEEGLKEEPTNVRYMFYLAQTYHSLRRFQESITMYKKRFKAGGWNEEQWYSLYMIGQSWLSLGDPIKFEMYMLKAYAFRPGRAESLYKLVKYFREQGKQFKAYQYMLMGKNIPLSTDSLFIEMPVYNDLFYYEKSILDYYVNPDKKEGNRSSIQYLLRSTDMLQNVLSNLHFYALPLPSTIHSLNTPQPFGPEFRSSAISMINYPYANVRYVNYWIDNGDYKTPRGEPVQTHNAYVNLDSMEVIHTMDDSTIGLPTREHIVRGLEDVRVSGDEFTAVVHNYDQYIRVMRGIYDRKRGIYSNCEVLPSPAVRHCEKNWLLMEGSPHMIYEWHPLRIMRKDCSTEVVHVTPQFFTMLRGSASGRLHKGEMWVLTHFVEYTKPRKYYHCFVTLNKDTYKPIALSLPFVFKSAAIEYCTSFTISDIGQIKFYASFNDSNSSVVHAHTNALEFVSI
jgi:glycosyltransferase involved in cell wall biosynthesis